MGSVKVGRMEALLRINHPQLAYTLLEPLFLVQDSVGKILLMADSLDAAFLKRGGIFDLKSIRYHAQVGPSSADVQLTATESVLKRQVVVGSFLLVRKVGLKALVVVNHLDTLIFGRWPSDTWEVGFSGDLFTHVRNTHV